GPLRRAHRRELRLPVGPPRRRPTRLHRAPLGDLVQPRPGAVADGARRPRRPDSLGGHPAPGLLPRPHLGGPGGAADAGDVPGRPVRCTVLAAALVVSACGDDVLPASTLGARLLADPSLSTSPLNSFGCSDCHLVLAGPVPPGGPILPGANLFDV